MVALLHRCAGLLSAPLVLVLVAAAEAQAGGEQPSCDWTMEPHRDDFRLLSASNGAPTSWQFGDGRSAVQVSRTYHESGLGHPCWDQTLRFESVDPSVVTAPVPSAIAAVVISGTTEAVLGGSERSDRVQWELTEGRAPDASRGSKSSSTSSGRVGGSRRWTYWLDCMDNDSSHAIATVTTEQAESSAAWTLRVRLVRTCPGVWSHLAVNVSPPSVDG